ncbi:uncharacterized protein BCR38DRAFT_445136 [Pseudomassariella vexata]|uniref:Chitin-binding type-1 domain-containing protein n=1 Tax=Pseudomassariella vexata TaxID=1141098 RepID=A0A1Y2DK97_9PEZI|nr:uncharacterized protein BCR38DRAFT_445136 [Pseudomassariella vexata]ORY59652.1 hypothetical protein BCR38DRAFT_445136 [Pseudomassariella vexata]
MRFLFSSLALALSASAVLIENCGPKFGNQICAAGDCCSQYGWCDSDAAHCDPANCLQKFSGKGSSCAKLSTTSPVAKPVTTTKSAFASQVPNIDVCGSAQGGVSCPGAGINSYFYRCCSSAGHCGPKNDIQDQGLYCGTGCQAGFGNCNVGVAKPPKPSGTPGISQAGETCGPIVNKKCASGLCCSGSNFCGTGTDFCGAANWCQPSWGKCS